MRADGDGARLARERKRVVFHRFLARLVEVAAAEWMLKGAHRFRVEASLAGRPFEAFVLDVGFTDDVIDTEILTTPDLLDFAGIGPVEVPTTKIAVQVAEKLHAYTRIFDGGRVSTRTNDLVDDDLVAGHTTAAAGIDSFHAANYVSHMVMFPHAQQTTQYLTVPGGRIGYDVQGQGPLLVLLPGMGELRSSYRHLVPGLVDAGNQVVTADLRGHGDSDTSFTSYGDEPTATDLTALLRHLDAPAVVVGNSMAAASAVLVAAEHPDLVTALVLLGPFVRNPVDDSPVKRLMFRALMARPWARAAWNAYLPTLYSGRKPADFQDYRTAMIAAMKRPGYTTSFRLTTRADHAAAEMALESVRAPSLVVMGERDPDFADPAAEAEWIAKRLGGSVQMIAEAGHYPQSQQPEVTAGAILGFLREVRPRG